MPNRTRLFDFRTQQIAGPGPCDRSPVWPFDEDDLPPKLETGEPSYGKTIWELPDLTDAWYIPEWTHPLLEQARIRDQMGAHVKLWHDDVRRPPDDSWLWARSNADAMVVLGSEVIVDILSMDHDLGGSDIPEDELDSILGNPDYAAITGHSTGVDLAEYIGRNDLFPAEIVIHSMNPIGSGRILGVFQKWAPRSERIGLIRVEPFSR